VALDGLVRAGVALASALTASLQAAVTVEFWLSQDALGTPTYGAAVPLRALVEAKTRRVLAPDGREVLATTKVTILTPVTLTVRDRLTLPDGTAPPIVAIEGLVDPGATPPGQPYLLEVWMG
jgi:hypothetical protein